MKRQRLCEWRISYQLDQENNEWIAYTTSTVPTVYGTGDTPNDAVTDLKDKICIYWDTLRLLQTRSHQTINVSEDDIEKSSNIYWMANYISIKI
jgi:hypothetical protein